MYQHPHLLRQHPHPWYKLHPLLPLFLLQHPWPLPQRCQHHLHS